MSSAVLKGGDALSAKLSQLMQQYESKELSVGFLAGAKYTNGEYVAAVAFQNEFGNGHIPARPFFRPMIAHNHAHWGVKLAKAFTLGIDSGKAMGMLGMAIEGELQDSIRQVTSPALSPVTLMMRKHKGISLNEAKQRLSDGESTGGVNAKPLIDTSHMINSISSEVK